MARKELIGEDWINSRQKRAMDICVATSLLPVALPVGAIALGLNRVIDGEDVIFRQTRIGQGGEPFVISKIRTMRAPDPLEADNPKDRITWFGGKLRRLCIDEIPQIKNVLDGSMSLVGPRLAREAYIQKMEAALPRNSFDEWLDAYYRSIPGGVSSFGIACRSDLEGEPTYLEKAHLDLRDFHNASARYDFGLLRQASRIGSRLILKSVLGKSGGHSR
jgi:lipopolysaccharide/colanic/teichoic acid biosynthesis glycosyltransferase